jgi:hypothetical protein
MKEELDANVTRSLWKNRISVASAADFYQGGIFYHATAGSIDYFLIMEQLL